MMSIFSENSFFKKEERTQWLYILETWCEKKGISQKIREEGIKSALLPHFSDKPVYMQIEMHSVHGLRTL